MGRRGSADCLERMPKLQTYQELRREYQRLMDGTLTAEEFGKERAKTLAALKLKTATAFAFAAKVIQSTQIIREDYVKEVNRATWSRWAIRGLYRQIDEKIPDDDSRARLDKVRDLSEAELTALLADVRESLGQREDLDNHKDIDFALQRMLAHLDPYTTYIDPETIARFTTETTGEFEASAFPSGRTAARGMLQVVTPLKDSPAYRAGLKAGDLITSITRYEDDNGPCPERARSDPHQRPDDLRRGQEDPGQARHQGQADRGSGKEPSSRWNSRSAGP